MSHDNTLSSALTKTELQALWRQVWLIARRVCRGTLVRLSRGQGGLYDRSDFAQDAFLSFRALALRWAAEEPRAPENDLWSAWRRCLWHNGTSILRRPPQRLWDRAETPGLDIEALVDDAIGYSDGEVARAASEQLVDWGDPARLLEESEEESRGRALIGSALAALSPSRQTLIQWLVIEERPVAEVAATLGTSRSAVYSRLSRALAALRREARALSQDSRVE